MQHNTCIKPLPSEVYFYHKKCVPEQKYEEKYSITLNSIKYKYKGK